MRSLLILLLLLALTAPAAFAERQGIVIGNRDYPDSGRFPDLATTLNDAALIYQLMMQAGFKMAPSVRDATRSDMENALISFCNGLKPGDEAVVYFAGHGVQFENKVYLMGTNAEFLIKARLNEEAVSQETVVKMLGEREIKLAVLILDCCRADPDQSWLATENRTRGFRGWEAPALSPPPNILVGYATSSGRLTNDALREKDANGPLVLALQKHWSEGLEVDPLWKTVARDVFTASRSTTQGEAEIQMPSKYGQTIYDFYFVSKESLAASPPATRMNQAESQPAPAPPAVLDQPPAPVSPPVTTITTLSMPSLKSIERLEHLFSASPYSDYDVRQKSEILKLVQKQLSEAADGVPGEKTQSSLSSWQRLHSLQATTRLDTETLNRMGLGGISRVVYPAPRPRVVTSSAESPRPPKPRPDTPSEQTRNIPKPSVSRGNDGDMSIEEFERRARALQTR